MLRDEISDAFRQAHFFGESQSVRHMTGDDLRALNWAQAIVRILTALVFDKMLGCGDLTNIVVQPPDTREDSVRANRPTGIFRQLTDRVRMLVRTRRAYGQLA